MTNAECMNVLRAMTISGSVTEKEAVDHVEKLIKRAKKAKRWKRKYIKLLNDIEFSPYQKGKYKMKGLIIWLWFNGIFLGWMFHALYKSTKELLAERKGEI